MADTSMPGIKLEQEYDDFLKKINLQRSRVACILGAMLVVASSLLDYFMHPDFFLTFLSIRVACAIFVIGVYLVSFTEFGRKRALLIGMSVALSIAAAISTLIRFLGYETPYYAGLNLIILAIGVLFPWRMKESLFACLVIYAMYLVPILMFDKLSNYRMFVNNNLFMIETIIIAIAANYFTSKLRFQEFVSRYKLSEAYEQLKGLDELKTQFFSNISHELRTPLTLLLAPVESILKGEAGNITPQGYHLVETIHSNTLRLLKLINNLLDLSKIDAGKMNVNYEMADLNKFIKGISAEVLPVAEKKNLSLEFIAGEDIPPFYFDPDKIERVLLNIIYNSIKFTEKGRIIIKSQRENNNAVVRVMDTGIGIEDKDLEKIFDRFVQLDGSSKRRQEGTGIGLPLAKELVELHKGNIKVESNVGKGTTITFSLPLVLEYKEAGKEDVESTKKGDDWTRAKYREAVYSNTDIIQATEKEIPPIPILSNGKKILIVEDNIDMQDFIAFQLRDEYKILKAPDGQTGLEIAQKEIPDLIIADIMMPLMDGYELCKKIREDPRIKHIPVIFLTAKAGLDMKITGYEKGADEYLVKPFNAEELRARIKSLLNLRQLEREIQQRNEELERTLKQLKETQTQLVHSEKMASLGRLVAGIAHEMNNPIAAAISSSNALCRHIEKSEKGEESLDNESVRKKLGGTIQNLQQGLTRASNIITDLKIFSKKDVSGIKNNNIHEGLDSTLNILQSPISSKNITIHKDYSYKGIVECSLGSINQVFMNILQNSIDAIHNKGDIWISIKREGDNAKISIKDNGIGIKKEDLSKVFDPFFTTKDVGSGVGLGLSISYSIIKEHQGTIEINSDEGKGTEVFIALPIKQRMVIKQ